MTHKPSADEVAAYAAGRADGAAILSHAAAKGRRQAAALLCANPSITVAEAAQMLASMPGKAATTPAAAQTGAPTFQEMVDDNVRKMLGKTKSPRTA